MLCYFKNIICRCHIDFEVYRMDIFLRLAPHCPGLGYCLFMKFGQAILIRVLVLNF